MDFLFGALTGAQSLDALIRWGGYTVLFVIVFVETGLFAFLPGDSLLISAGLVAAAGHLNIWWLNVLLSVAAVLGDNVGYAIGARIAPRLSTREKSLLFNPAHVERTRRFYDRHGAKAIVIARFVPIVRTFAPIVAGVAGMPYRRFFFYNVVGGTGWVLSMTWAGYLLGQTVPNIDRHIHIVVIIVIVRGWAAASATSRTPSSRADGGWRWRISATSFPSAAPPSGAASTVIPAGISASCSSSCVSFSRVRSRDSSSASPSMGWSTSKRSWPRMAGPLRCRPISGTGSSCRRLIGCRPTIWRSSSARWTRRR